MNLPIRWIKINSPSSRKPSGKKGWTQALASLPRKIGVYLFRGKGGILYIGKANTIRERVKHHFLQPSFRDRFFTNQITKVGYLITDSEVKALLLESQLIKKYQPKYNVMWKDDKNYFYVAITQHKLPRVFITHQPSTIAKIINRKSKVHKDSQRAGAHYIGPFIDGNALKKTLRFLRQVFPYFTQKNHPLTPCPWCHLQLCPGPNPSLKEYRKNIKNIIQVLGGKKTSVLRKLQQEMKEAAKKQEFERAAKIRDQILALENVFSHAKVLSWEQDEKLTQKQLEQSLWEKTQAALQKILKIKKPISRIEACDIANIQGQQATGSIVTFINGKPAKDFYRKFKIKISGKPNDPAMIAEILSRRLSHQEWGMPDIILVDGGITQLNAAIRIKNRKSNANDQYKIIALAKRHNELFIEGRKTPLLLKNCPQDVAKIILHLRDEAHRFARKYHHELRSRAVAK
jgi:excinuclease ABC subunit C